MRLILAAAMLCGWAGSASTYASNMVTDWNNDFLLITQQTSGNLVTGPPEVAREIAQMGAAMSDAVNAATGANTASFAYTGGAAAGADANAAAAAAAYTALTTVFTSPVWSSPINQLTTNPALASNTSNTTLASNTVIPELKSMLLSSLGLSSISDVCATPASPLCNGYNLGIAAATAVSNTPTFSPTGSGAVAAITKGLNVNIPANSGSPGVYVPPSSRPEMLPTWNTTALTGITSDQLASAKARIGGPPAITSASYASALLQTECQGGGAALSTRSAGIQSACAAAGFAQQTTAQAKAALFWNDPGTTAQPPGHWLQIANTALTSKSSSLLQSARLTSLLGEAMNDAGILAWEQKYAYNLWRPVTAIRDCSNWSAGQFTTCDPTWSSLIATPPHPDYIAGHPAFSGAAATVLADFFGTDQVSFNSTSNYYCNGAKPAFDPNTSLLVSCTDSKGTVWSVTHAADCAVIVDGVNSNASPLICPITESFSSFSDASQGDNGAEYSRVAGGIHTPFAVQDALAAGDFIGQALAQNAGLPEVVPEPSSLALCGIGLLSLSRLRRRRPINSA